MYIDNYHEANYFTGDQDLLYRLKDVCKNLQLTNEKQNFNMDKLANYTDTIMNMAIAYAPKVVLAIVALILGFWIVGAITKWIGRWMDRSEIDKDVQPFLKSLVGVMLKVMVLLSVASIVGIETTSFIAVLAAAGFAIGMALQGSLGNFASGVMVLIFKPYRVGDLVSMQDKLGHVDEIQIFNTIMTSLDNKKIIVPNAIATSGIIENLSTKDVLRVDLNVAMPYEEDFDKVQRIILDAIGKTPKVLENPGPVVEIEKFDENGVLLAVRPYSTTADYWDVYFNTYKNVKKALGEAGIKVPYPVKLNKEF